MFKSPNLDLTYVAPSQAQKHVTVNETFRRLDALVQMTLQSITQASQPSAPEDGDIYGLPEGKTGADWEAMTAHNVAAYQDGAWVELAPKAGWQAFVADQNLLHYFDGSWRPLSNNDGSDSITNHAALNGLLDDDHPQYLTQGRGDRRYALHSTIGSAASLNVGTSANDVVQLNNSGSLPAIDGSNLTNLPQTPPTEFTSKLGINATADNYNKLSINSEAVLFNNTGASTRLTVNKASENNTGSFVFQTGFSARAEIGLTGNDDFHFKVSPDGSSFKDGIILDKNTGRARFPSTPTFAILQSGRFHLYTDNRWITNSNDDYGTNTENYFQSGGTGTYPTITWDQVGHYLPKGAKIHRINFLARADHSEVEDLDLFFFAKIPNSPDLWDNGFDSDNDRTVVNTYRDFFVKPTQGETQLPGTGMSSMRKRTIDVNFTMPEDGYFSLFLKPQGTITSLRYVHFQMMIECSLG